MEKDHNDHILYVYAGSSGSSGREREANKHEIYQSLLGLIFTELGGMVTLGLPGPTISSLQ